MNFKVLLLVFWLTACGVDKPPRPPAGTSIPSLPTKYLQTPESIQKALQEENNPSDSKLDKSSDKGTDKK